MSVLLCIVLCSNLTCRLRVVRKYQNHQMQNTSSQEFQTPGQDSKPRKKKYFSVGKFPSEVIYERNKFFPCFVLGRVASKNIYFLYIII